MPKTSGKTEFSFSATCWASLLSEPQLSHRSICSQVWLSLVVASLDPEVNMFTVFGVPCDQ